MMVFSQGLCKAYLIMDTLEQHWHRRIQRLRAQIWSPIEPGAVADAALCRYTPLLARQET
jgi:hypothetical protein